MEYEDIIPDGLTGKTEAEREEIIEHWEELHDLKQAILEGEIPDARDQLPDIEKELAEVSKKLEPKEAVPETGVLIKDDKQYVLCPRCGTFVQFTKERVRELAHPLFFGQSLTLTQTGPCCIMPDGTKHH